MRYIDDIIIHCTATLPQQRVTLADIDRWHKQQGFDTIGYHYVVGVDGTIFHGRHLDVAGAHCKGHNAHSVGIAYIGGLDSEGRPSDTRTAPQMAAILKLIAALRVTLGSHLTVHGHHDYNPHKACPCYDVMRDVAASSFDY